MNTAWHDLAFDERAKWIGVADFAAEFDAGDGGLEIVGVGQRIGLDLYRVEWVGAGQA